MKDGFYFDTSANGVVMFGTHHDYDASRLQKKRQIQPNETDLCAPILRGSRLFRPLVRKSLAISCTLKILFLRKEIPGGVYQGGDLDNRLKTLLDSLSVPAHPEQVINDDRTIEDPILCLVEDDALITGLSITTDRLLSQPNASKSEVRMYIEVDVWLTDARVYNTTFLGGLDGRKFFESVFAWPRAACTALAATALVALASC